MKLYYLYKKSSKRVRGLQERCEVYKESFEFANGAVKPKRSNGTQWVSHKLHALELFVEKNWHLHPASRVM